MTRPAMVHCDVAAVRNDQPAGKTSAPSADSLNNTRQTNRSTLSFWLITLLALVSSASSAQITSGSMAPKTNAPQLRTAAPVCSFVLQSRLRGGKGKGKDVTDAYSGIEAPKRPLSAYMIFAGAERPNIVQSQPTLKMTEISGVIGERWKKLKPEDKKKYETQAEALKKKYEKSKADYESKVPEDVRKERQANKSKAKRGSAKPKKDPNAPKKPHSAFMIYSISVREQVRADDPSLSFGDVGRRIAEQWNKKTPAEKKAYEDKAVVLKEKYIAEKAKYDANKAAEPEEEAPAKVSKAKPKKDKVEKAK